MENVTKAVAFMSESKSVADWNLRRSQMIRKYGNDRNVINAIDGQGLIVKVLGMDKIENGVAVRS